MCVLSVCNVRLSVNVSETVGHVLCQPMNLFGLVCRVLVEVYCSLHSIFNIGETKFLLKLAVNYVSFSMFCCDICCVSDALKSISLTIILCLRLGHP
jgi:hypothetical protein